MKRIIYLAAAGLLAAACTREPVFEADLQADRQEAIFGAEVPEDDVCRELEHFSFFDRRAFVWRDRIVFSTEAVNPTFLHKEADKRAFLEKYISPQKK